MPILVEVQRKRTDRITCSSIRRGSSHSNFITLDDSVYCLVKQCNDCAEIWPNEQIWQTCVDEDEENL